MRMTPYFGSIDQLSTVNTIPVSITTPGHYPAMVVNDRLPTVLVDFLGIGGLDFTCGMCSYQNKVIWFQNEIIYIYKNIVLGVYYISDTAQEVLTNDSCP